MYTIFQYGLFDETFYANPKYLVCYFIQSTSSNSYSILIRRFESYTFRSMFYLKNKISYDFSTYFYVQAFD